MGLKSPSDGCWMAETGQRCDEPLHEKKRRTFHPGHFGRARPRGNHPLQMGPLPLMDRTSPERVGCCLERVAGC
jgi:hypothetical protein